MLKGYDESEKAIVMEMKRKREDFERRHQLYFAEQKGKAEGIAEGKAEGIAEGKAEGASENLVNNIKTMHSKGLSEEEIANLLDLDVEFVKDALNK